MKRLQEIAVQVNRMVIFTTFILLLIVSVIILIKVHRVMGCRDFSQYDCRCEAKTGL